MGGGDFCNGVGLTVIGFGWDEVIIVGLSFNEDPDIGCNGLYIQDRPTYRSGIVLSCWN